ncbi:hypothetical protein SAMN07250955_101560 [Arboricoccus pini]|uniref:Uncharacterized protein n=1 Tax=Arboricoccus pini TaxID=1963835 RepID=A0A212QCI8_9PROT|nr:hypothetical protein SAMN07250955_101560 [Arboricoccus pini]
MLGELTCQGLGTSYRLLSALEHPLLTGRQDLFHGTIDTADDDSEHVVEIMGNTPRLAAERFGIAVLA